MAAEQAISISVTGMTCAACQARVQRALTKTPGVGAASVNLMTNTARVSYDATVTSPEQLVDAIRDTGYGADLPRGDRTALEEEKAQDAARSDEFANLRSKAIVAFTVGLVAMLTPMLFPEPPLSESSGAPAAWWVMLVAAAVVMAWAGRDFYIRAARGLRRGSVDMNTLISVGTGAAFAFSVVATCAPGRVPAPWRGAAGLLRSGDAHHRLHSRRARARGARQTADVARAARAGSACSRQPRACCLAARNDKLPSATCAVAT